MLSSLTLRLCSKVARLGRLLRVPPARANLTSTATRTTKYEEEPLGDEEIGYYAVSAGAIIRGRQGRKYEVVRKLGWGVNSSVWVGRNCSDNGLPKYVALKILNKAATREHNLEQAPSELNMLRRTYIGLAPQHRPQVPSYIERGFEGPPHPGWLRVAGFLGSFNCDRSRHLVIMSPLYGEHMKNYMRSEPEGQLTPALVKQIARQTLLALDYLHNQCGIIHSASDISISSSTDVKPENILRDFGLGPEANDTFEFILGKEPNAGRDGRSAPLWIPHIVDRPDLFFVVLADLSHASWYDLIQRSPRRVGSPALKAPELVMAYAFGTEIDIWAFGCTIFELLAGKSLFRFSDSRSPNELAQDPHYHVSLMQCLLGEPFFPAPAEGTITMKKGFIDPDGWIKNPVKSDTLDERVAKDLPDVGDKDMLVAFLRRCLKLDYRKRASATELLNDPWLPTDC